MTLTVTPADIDWFLQHPGTSQDEIRRWQEQEKIAIEGERQ